MELEAIAPGPGRPSLTLSPHQTKLSPPIGPSHRRFVRRFPACSVPEASTTIPPALASPQASGR